MLFFKKTKKHWTYLLPAGKRQRGQHNFDLLNHCLHSDEWNLSFRVCTECVDDYERNIEKLWKNMNFHAIPWLCAYIHRNIGFYDWIWHEFQLQIKRRVKKNNFQLKYDSVRVGSQLQWIIERIPFRFPFQSNEQKAAPYKKE